MKEGNLSYEMLRDRVSWKDWILQHLFPVDQFIIGGNAHWEIIILCQALLLFQLT